MPDELFIISRNWLTPEGRPSKVTKVPRCQSIRTQIQNPWLMCCTSHCFVDPALAYSAQVWMDSTAPLRGSRPLLPLRGCPQPLPTNGALAHPCCGHHPTFCILFPRMQPVRSLPPSCCRCSHNKDKARREAFLLSSSTRCDKRLSKHHLMWPALQNPHPSPESLWPLI